MAALEREKKIIAECTECKAEEVGLRELRRLQILFVCKNSVLVFWLATRTLTTYSLPTASIHIQLLLLLKQSAETLRS